MPDDALLRLQGLRHHYVQATGPLGLGLRRVDTLIDVDMEIAPASVTAVVGPSGSGKSTLLHVIAGLLPPTAGGLRWRTPSRTGPVRRAQLLFQDARASFDPKLPLAESLLEPLRAAGASSPAALVDARLREVGLDETILARRVGELSGGEAQRLALARALTLDPELLLADEPTASLDPVARDEILDLLEALRSSRGLAVLLVTHDLTLALRRADRVVVLSGGRIVEQLAAADFATSARHEVSRRLLSARDEL